MEVGISISSQVYLSFRLGLSWKDKYTGRPGSQQPFMLPVLGQWAVTILPSFNFTSAKNLL
jgi:hypothetical protein